MRVVHHATRLSGGAGIAARRIHEGLRRSGVDSWLRLAEAAPPGVDGVMEVEGMASPVGVPARVRRYLERRGIASEFEGYRDSLSPYLECFTDDRVAGPDRLLDGMDGGDVHHLHWTSGYLDVGKFCRRLPLGTPLVWSMHDMNPMTGGCHYAAPCEGFQGRCGSCPQLGSTRVEDLSAAILLRKRRALALLRRETTCFVAASRWMAEQAALSALLRDVRVEIIPYGLDTEVFRPREQALARAVFGLPADGFILLFAADHLDNHRKGLDLLLAALDADLRRRLVLVAIGHAGTRFPAGYEVHHLGRIDLPHVLAHAYAAADCFVTPARAEAFGQVALEAMACGLPVIAHAVGGLTDLVQPAVNGLLVEPGDVPGLRGAIVELLEDRERARAIGRAGRARAEREFPLSLQASRYQALYQQLCEQSGALRACAS